MSPSPRAFYQLVWRWHFYAGLFVAPFMVLLSLTGAIYLFKPQLDTLMYRPLLVVAPAGEAQPIDRQLELVRAAWPDASIKQVYPQPAPDRSTQVVVTQQGREYNVFVDPYRGRILGDQDAHRTLQAIARGLHAELLIGTVGDRLIELAAGWGLVLLISGLYLWWPRGAQRRILLWPRRLHGRAFWHDLHASAGFWGALGLLFILMSGMAWTGFWGKEFAGLWNRFPAAMWTEVPKSGLDTASLNVATRQTVAWAVENTPLPASAVPEDEAGSHAGHAGHEGHDAHAGHRMTSPDRPRIGVQAVADIARQRQVQPGYSITLPTRPDGVYTVAIFADDPRNDATLHIDQYSGRVLADVRWRDYGPVAKSVEMSTMLHMGKAFGLANQLLMLLACVLVLASSVSGVIMWWIRRPAGRLGVPPQTGPAPQWRGALALMVVLGLLFPLVGLSMAAIWILDLLLGRLRPAQAA